MNYKEFLKNKQKTIQSSGFEVETLNPLLFPFQSFIVRKALKAGKYAIFANTGLVKTSPPKYLFSVKIGNRIDNVFKPIIEYREYKFYHLIFGIFKQE